MPDYMKFFRDRHTASLGRPDAERIRQMSLAFIEYEQARMLVAITRADYIRHDGDPFACPRCGPPFLFAGIMMETLDEGGDPQAVFDRYADEIAWRPMKREERATPGQLLALMSKSSRDTAMELFGPAAVVKQIVADRALALL